MSKVDITLDDLKRLCELAQRNGKEASAIQLCLEWAAAAEAEIRRLRAELERMKPKSHLEVDWEKEP